MDQVEGEYLDAYIALSLVLLHAPRWVTGFAAVEAKQHFAKVTFIWGSYFAAWSSDTYCCKKFSQRVGEEQGPGCRFVTRRWCS